MSLVVNGIFKTYGKRPVVQDVSFSVDSGEIVGLLGPNGAGKTTSFYTVVGVVQPDVGTITLNGKRLNGLPIHTRAKQGLGYLPQESSVFRGLSVEDNLNLVLDFQTGSIKEKNQRRESLLEEFGLGKVKQSLAIQLSGGERRRLEIARALAANPQFLLLDEPFTGIDPITIEDLQQLIFHLKARGLGILITDHNPHATLALVDRAYVMFDGKLIFSGTSNEVATSPLVKQAYLGEGFQLQASSATTVTARS
jgi:lipopolysaccharide export system ATP-binding protein